MNHVNHDTLTAPSLTGYLFFNLCILLVMLTSMVFSNNAPLDLFTFVLVVVYAGGISLGSILLIVFNINGGAEE